MTNDTEQELREAALRIFPEAWGSEYVEGDPEDEAALRQLIDQERRYRSRPVEDPC